MPTKIIVVESSTFKVPAGSWPQAETIQLNQIKDALTKGGNTFVAGDRDLKNDPSFVSFLEGYPQTISAAYFARTEDATRFSPTLAFLQAESRSTGIKATLAAGSTVFTESFFSASALGSKLDVCYDLAQKTLKPETSVGAWAAIQAMIFLGLRSLPDHGNKNTGDKVDLQIGTDTAKLACSLCFTITPNRLNEFRGHPLLEVLRNSAGLFEVRYHKEGSRIEILALFFAGESPEWAIECQTFAATTPLEDGSVKDYAFRTLGSMRENGGAAPAKASPFKKKFSDKMKESAPPPAPATAAPANGGTEVIMNLTAKVENLENAVREKEALLVKQTQQLKELQKNSTAGAAGPAVDPKAKDKDATITALKNQVGKLEEELADALEKEEAADAKEALPAGMKDQFLRKIKDLEVKLKAAQDERNGKLIALEKQLEDNKKKMKDMSKRITELTEQLRDAA